MAAQLSQLKNQADNNSDRLDNEVKDHAKATLASCSGDNKIAWNGSVWSCTSETDPTVYSFAQTQLPDCGSDKILTGDGTNLSCVDSSGLSGFEIDPTVYDFAKVALPNCGNDKVLSGDGTSLACVSASSLSGFETDPTVKQFAKNNLPNCSAGEVLTGDGTALACVADNDGSGFVEQDPQVGTLNANKWCLANGGGTAIDCTSDAPSFTETDPKVGTLTNGKWCTSNGTTVSCTSDAPSDPGDNLGNHTATQNLNMGGNSITNGGNIRGAAIFTDDYSGDLWCRANASGRIYCNKSLTGDNLGSHTATANLAMGAYAITSSAGTIRDANGGWVRTYGNTGWFNGTHTGGWFMNDTTWVRSYNNKAVYTGGVMRADGGFQVGNNGANFLVSGAGAVATAGNITSSGDISGAKIFTANYSGDRWCRANTSGQIVCTQSAPGGSDDLGNHVATTTLNMNGYNITGANAIYGAIFFTNDYSGGRWCQANTNGRIMCTQNAPVMAESDPKINVLNANNWCAANAAGTLINCNKSAPLTSESDPKVGGITANHFCAGNGSGKVNCSNNQIYLSSGNIGVGTASPNVKLHVNGDVRATAYFHTSDRRLKDDIQPSGGLDIIGKLEGVSFKWKDGGRMAHGLIAQDVEKLLPHAVHTNTTDGIKAVDYDQIIAPLIEAVKELKAENNSLRHRLESLEAARQ